MERVIRISGIALICALMAFSCVIARDARAQAPGGRGPSDAEMTLMRLKGLVAAGDSDVAITKEQASAMLPILKAWRAKVSSASASDMKTYAASLEAALTDEQKVYRPEPPRGGPMGGDPQRGRQPSDGNGGPGGHGGGPVSALLDELITALSKG